MSDKEYPPETSVLEMCENMEKDKMTDKEIIKAERDILAQNMHEGYLRLYERIDIYKAERNKAVEFINKIATQPIRVLYEDENGQAIEYSPFQQEAQQFINKLEKLDEPI